MFTRGLPSTGAPTAMLGYSDEQLLPHAGDNGPRPWCARSSCHRFASAHGDRADLARFKGRQGDDRRTSARFGFCGDRVYAAHIQ